MKGFGFSKKLYLHKNLTMPQYSVYTSKVVECMMIINGSFKKIKN